MPSLEWTRLASGVWATQRAIVDLMPTLMRVQLCASRPRLFACLRDCPGVHVLVVVQRIQRSVTAFDGLRSSHLWLLASQPPRSHHTTPTINCNFTLCPANATDCTVLCQGALLSDPRAISGCVLSVAAT
jgi:hypothetical protein